jgi:hypothetical protein
MSIMSRENQTFIKKKEDEHSLLSVYAAWSKKVQVHPGLNKHEYCDIRTYVRTRVNKKDFGMQIIRVRFTLYSGTLEFSPGSVMAPGATPPRPLPLPGILVFALYRCVGSPAIVDHLCCYVLTPVALFSLLIIFITYSNLDMKNGSLSNIDSVLSLSNSFLLLWESSTSLAVWLYRSFDDDDPGRSRCQRYVWGDATSFIQAEVDLLLAALLTERTGGDGAAADEQVFHFKLSRQCVFPRPLDPLVALRPFLRFFVRCPRPRRRLRPPLDVSSQKLWWVEDSAKREKRAEREKPRRSQCLRSCGSEGATEPAAFVSSAWAFFLLATLLTVAAAAAVGARTKSRRRLRSAAFLSSKAGLGRRGWWGRRREGEERE